MQRQTPTRNAVSAPQSSGVMLHACIALLVTAFALSGAAQTAPAPQSQPSQQQHWHRGNQMQGSQSPHGQDHLGPWLANHQNLTPEEQQSALAQEPGFKSLTPQQQQRMQQRLTQLNTMPPEQRQRMIDHVEEMERLTPQQRQQVRSAMDQLSSLPPDRRRAVARTFHEFRTMPPGQRQQVINSPDYQHQFSDQERGMLNNLMAVEPLLPPPTPWR